MSSGIDSVSNNGNGGSGGYQRHPGNPEAKKKALKAISLQKSAIRDVYIPQDQSVNISASYGRDPRLKSALKKQVLQQSPGRNEES